MRGAVVVYMVNLQKYWFDHTATLAVTFVTTVGCKYLIFQHLPHRR